MAAGLEHDAEPARKIASAGTREDPTADGKRKHRDGPSGPKRRAAASAVRLRLKSQLPDN